MEATVVTTTFPGDGSYAFAVALQADGKIIAAGTDYVDLNLGDMSDTDFALARYNSDGSPDSTFGNGGTATTDFFGTEDDAFSALIQQDGKIIAVGSTNDPARFYDFAAVRYLSDGTIDTTFGVAGKVSTDFGARGLDQALSATLQTDGKIVAVGFVTSASGISENSPSPATPQAVYSTPPSVATGGRKSVSAAVVRMPGRCSCKMMVKLSHWVSRIANNRILTFC